MPRIGGIFQLLPGSYGGPANTPIKSAPYNAQLDDFVNEANGARPVSAGGTGGANVIDAATNLDVVSKGVAGDIMRGPLVVKSSIRFESGGPYSPGAIFSNSAFGVTIRAYQALATTASVALQRSDDFPLLHLLENGARKSVIKGTASFLEAFDCRAWVRCDNAGGILGSGNVSSVTRLSAGRYQVNFAVALPDAAFAAVASSESKEAGCYDPQVGSVKVFVGSTTPTDASFSLMVVR